MARSCPQPSEGMAEVGAAVSGAEQGGRRCSELREDFCGIGSGGHAIWVGDVGHDTEHWEGLGRIPLQSGPQYDREKTSESTGRWMGVYPSGGSDGGGGIAGGGYLRIPSPEHSRKVHCNQAHYGPVSGGGTEYGVNGVQ